MVVSVSPVPSDVPRLSPWDRLLSTPLDPELDKCKRMDGCLKNLSVSNGYVCLGFILLADKTFVSRSSLLAPKSQNMYGHSASRENRGNHKMVYVKFML